MNAFAHRVSTTGSAVRRGGAARALSRLGASVTGTCVVLLVLASLADRIA